MSQEKLNDKRSLVLPMFLMSLMGGFYWAIRGTTGFGGSTGGAFAGLGWAILWFYLSYEKQEVKTRPYRLGWVVLAITMGITIGGFNGYGIFISWVSDRFYLTYQGTWIPLTTPLGYVGLFFCGLQWGGNAGILMSWCGSKNPLRKKDWIIRILFGVGGACIAYLMVQLIPGLIYPYFEAGYYSDFTTCPECQKVIEIITNLAIFNGIFFGFLLYEVYRKAWRNVKLALTLALGFALSFSIFVLWQLGWRYFDWQIDWWKNWEMSIGLGGGATFGLAHYFFNQPRKNQTPSSAHPAQASKHRSAEKLVGFYLPIWLVLNIAVFNALGGVAEIWGFPLGVTHYLALGGLFFIPTTALFVRAIYKIKINPFQKGDARENITKVPLYIFFTIVMLIGVGYAVTVPPEMTLASLVLLVLYSIYIGGSALILNSFRARRLRPASVGI